MTEFTLDDLMFKPGLMKGQRILITGGGIGGLTSAIALCRKGYEVEVIERDPDWSVYGVGIIQQGNVVRAMTELGLIDDYISAGFGFVRVQVYIPTGVCVADIPTPRLVEGYPGNVGIGRRALHKVLGDRTIGSGAEVRLGVTLNDLHDDGEGVDVQPWAVLFNQQAFLQFAHMWVGAYMLAGFTIAGVYAVGMLRGRRDEHHRLGFLVPFVFASVAAVTQPFVGHVLGFGLDERQPAKLAAFELAETTESPSPLRLGGVLVDGEVRYSIDIPVLGSLIAMNSPDEPVPGLDTVPEEDHPPVNLTHLAFQTMVGIGTLLAAAVVLFWFQRRRGRDLLERRWFLRFAAAAGPLAVIALEAGWIATEVGRQPWIVYGVMRTPEAVGDYTASLWWLLGITTVVYTAMTVGAVVVLRSMARRWRAGDVDLPSPYAPEVSR